MHESVEVWCLSSGFKDYLGVSCWGVGGRIPTLWHSDLWEVFSTTFPSQNLYSWVTMLHKRLLTKLLRTWRQVSRCWTKDSLWGRFLKMHSHKLLAFYLSGVLPWNAGVSPMDCCCICWGWRRIMLASTVTELVSLNSVPDLSAEIKQIKHSLKYSL